MKNKLLIAAAIPGALVIVFITLNLINNRAMVRSNSKYDKFVLETSVEETIVDESSEAQSVTVESTTETYTEATTEFVPLKESDALSSYLNTIVIAFNIESDLYQQVLSTVYNKVDATKAIYVFGAGYNREGPYIAYTVYDSTTNTFTDIDDILSEDTVDYGNVNVKYESRDELINSRK